MCGIYGMIGTKNVVEFVMKGISGLEYRGYDSAGIALLNNGELCAIKTVGQINMLVNEVNKVKPQSNVAIAHTRWATHGKPTVSNAHPHFSVDKKLCIVHNGIIDNFNELKKEINSKFYSDTDSEVIVKLLEKYYNGNMLKTIKTVCDKLKGSYALAILNERESNKIYVTKSVSPCVVGMGENGTSVCSDINGINNVDYAYILQNNNIAVLESNKITIFDNELNIISLDKIKVEKNNEQCLGKFKHFMQKEIHEIPKSILNTVENYYNFDKLKQALPAHVVKNLKNMIIIGCGTAYHAGLMGRKFLEENINLNIKNEIASEFTYSDFKPNKNTLMVFVSQSGETADTLKALRLSKAYGLKTLAITNVLNSTICFEADYLLITCAGSEIAVASTKAYAGQLTMFYLLAAYIKQVQQDLDEDLVFLEGKNLIRVAGCIDVPAFNEKAKNISEQIHTAESLFMIGRGHDYITALEASLKLKEITYIHSEAYPSGELKHGTISLIDDRTFVFGFVTNQNLEEKSLNNIQEVISRGGIAIVLTQNSFKQDKIHEIIKLPKVEGYYMPLISIVVMQLIAYNTSLLKGINPDKPRSLAKAVTVE